MIYMLPQAKFTQTTAQLKRRRKGKKKKKSDREKTLHTHTHTLTHTQKNLVLVDEGETFCKEKKLSTTSLSNPDLVREGGGRKEVVNIITSALRFI